MIVNVCILTIQRAVSSLIAHSIGILEESLNVASLDSPRVLCLGLGSPSTSTNARVQLGFLLNICDHLKVVCKNSLYYVYTSELSIFAL